MKNNLSCSEPHSLYQIYEVEQILATTIMKNQSDDDFDHLAKKYKASVIYTIINFVTHRLSANIALYH